MEIPSDVINHAENFFSMSFDSMNHAAPFLVVGALLLIALTIFLVWLIVKIFFCASIYKVLSKVPEDKLEFPAWFTWLMLIPLAGIVFSWLTLPFNVPRSCARLLAGNARAEASLKTLFGLGLALVILETVTLIPYLGLLTAIPALIILIIYWVKLVEFRRTFLDKIS